MLMFDSLDPVALPAADDLLATETTADRAMRVRLLQRMLDAPEDRLTVVTRRELATRLATTLLGMNDPQGALTTLATIEGDATPAMAETGFEANVRLGRFEDAAGIHAEPEPWVLQLSAPIGEDTFGVRGG